MHVLRDLLFPDIRALPAAERAVKSFLDRPIAGETADDFAARIALHDRAMQWADWAGLPDLHARHTTLFRYGIAVVTGLMLMAVLMVIHKVSSLFAKVCLRVCLRVTRHEAFADDDSDGELALGFKYEQAREAKQAEKERLKALKAAGASAAAAACGATAGQVAAAPDAAAPASTEAAATADGPTTAGVPSTEGAEASAAASGTAAGQAPAEGLRRRARAAAATT